MAHSISDQQEAALSIAIQTLEKLPGVGIATHEGGISKDVLEILRRMIKRPHDAHLTFQKARDVAEGGAESPADPSADPIDELLDEEEDPIDEAARAWGEMLRHRRESVSLTRPQLARLASISVSTLKNLEAGRRTPTRLTLSRLLAVRELNLEPTDPLLRYPFHESAPDPAPNCWLAPGFDSIKMIKELVLQLNGRGGHIEQSFLYLDHLSSACWCAIADQEDYVAAQSNKPLDRAASAILRSVGNAGIDVLGLGCGDGKTEVRLVQHLLERTENGDLRLYLVDISQPLLSAAYKHAADTLADRKGVAMFAIQGNFHDLPRYTQLLYTPERAHRRRVVCMFGYTFGNLQNEILFVRNSLLGFAPGDLLLLDLGLVCAPADQTEEIKRLDPRLANRLPVGWRTRYEEWLAGPIRRYAKDATSVTFRSVLDTASCPVPGSYAVEVRANVGLAGHGHGHGGEIEKEFAIFRVKRYDIVRLVQCLRQLGWEPVDGWQYGGDPRALYLFRCRESL